MDTTVNRTKQKAKQTGEQASNSVKPWVRGFARFGYMAKGFVYTLLGILSLLAALGVGGGKTSDTQGVFATVASQPFGNALLWIVAVGLIGYVVWRIIQAVQDPEHKGKDGSGIGARIGYLVSAGIYTFLTFKAISIASSAGSSGSSGSGGSKQTVIAKLLSQPFGQWVIGIIGVGVIVYALAQIYKGMKEKFTKDFKLSEMNDHEKRIVTKTGKLGLTARGIVLAIIGYFFIVTAVTSNAQNAQGLDAALGKIASQPFGQWLLGLVAIGLACYGIFQIMKGKNKHLTLS
ncbi:membrane protein [Pontibacillus halophilus JSM 076056 = DSM 19796]|uniref:Membrane protein n=1 Tax=Pontibacillus halophilus JSM 076056 = DSM 19796 TaxID=1385510 RepID=A0A0A5GLI8_9BACI|nr:DUF1206 domain-containing protein [Pontibacillus halophilus]KGX91990.1 membrane protein [Pontibacillus halophilus JSM 076056 = DSM 19796]